ncbi:MAG: ATP-grasp domain-containing protein [Vicinamibacterales bacterium]
MRPGARVMILPAGIEQVFVIRKARALGLFVVAVDANPDAPGFADADATAIAAPRDIDRCLAIARQHAVDAVVADQCDYSLFASACIADLLGLHAPSVESAQLATNKRLMRERVERAGLAQPAFRACRTFEEAEAALAVTGLPAIFKPTDNRGCFGVSTARTAADAKESFYDALMNAHSREAIVETFLEGTMVTVDGYFFAPDHYLALGVATKRKVGGRRNVDMEVMYPAELPEAAIARVLEYNRRTVKALGLSFGATHGEYLVTADGTPYLIEVANRGGGVYTAPLIVPSLSNAPIPELLIRNAFGEFPAPEGVEAAPQGRSTVLSFIDFGMRGTLEHVGGVEAALAIPGVLAVHLLTPVGQPLPDITHGPSRHGFVIATAATAAASRALVGRVRDTLQVRVR